MPIRPKLLFDECIGIPAVESLRALLDVSNQDIELSHAVTLGFGGARDDVWIPQIANDGWLIISGDRGSRQKLSKGEKLPVLCIRHGITHVILSRAINKRKVFAKVQAIFTVWDEIIAAYSGPKGAGYLLRPSSGDHPILVLKSPVIAPGEEHKSQQDLFSADDDADDSEADA